MVLSRSDEAESAELRAAVIVAEKECCVIPQGLPGTAVRGPACTVVWEPGGETLRATRLGRLLLKNFINNRVCILVHGRPATRTCNKLLAIDIIGKHQHRLQPFSRRPLIQQLAAVYYGRHSESNLSGKAFNLLLRQFGSFEMIFGGANDPIYESALAAIILLVVGSDFHK